MSNFFFNKETASAIASDCDAIVDNEELSTLEKAIAISTLVSDINDMSHILIGGAAVNLFAAHVLSDDSFTVAERKEFITFTPTTQEEHEYFCSKNNVASMLYIYLEGHLENVIDKPSDLDVEEKKKQIAELMPLAYRSKILHNVLTTANISVQEAVHAVAIMAD